MATTEAQRRYNQKRSKVCKTYTIKYIPKEKRESLRLEKYLLDSNITANAYLKSLIKQDLDSKGIEYPTEEVERHGEEETKD